MAGLLDEPYPQLRQSLFGGMPKGLLAAPSPTKANSKVTSNKGLFDPLGTGFDFNSAEYAYMQPQQETGENKVDYGSMIPAPPEYKQRFGLPDNSYMMLKGEKHPTFQMAVKGEEIRGNKVMKLGDRYFSVPLDF
jgi:hypothetical protein